MISLHTLIEPTLVINNLYTYEIPRHGDIVDNIITNSDNVQLNIAGYLYDFNNIKINLISLGYHSCKLLIKSSTKPNVKVIYLLYDNIEYRKELSQMPWVLYGHINLFKIQENINLPLLNTIFNSFMSTNNFRDKWYSFQELLEVRRKQEFKFEWHNNIYLAHIIPKVKHGAKIVHIKLYNNSFKYIATNNTFKIVCPFQIKKECRQLSETLCSKYNNVIISYNVKMNCIKMKSYASNNTPHMLITFEHGYPYNDDDALLGPIL